MATTSPELKPQESVPFWRDVRVLGVIGQLVALALVLAGLAWLIRNFLENAEIQGLRIGFDFLNTTAAFDIAEGIEYQATDTFGRALWGGTPDQPPATEQRVYRATVNGSGAIAQDGSVAAGAGGIAIGGDVQGGVQISRQEGEGT